MMQRHSLSSFLTECMMFAGWSHRSPWNKLHFLTQHNVIVPSNVFKLHAGIMEGEKLVIHWLQGAKKSCTFLLCLTGTRWWWWRLRFCRQFVDCFYLSSPLRTVSLCFRAQLDLHCSCSLPHLNYMTKWRPENGYIFFLLLQFPVVCAYIIQFSFHFSCQRPRQLLRGDPVGWLLLDL